MSVFRPRRPRACVLASILLASVIDVSHAATLTLREAIDRASESNPTLNAFSFESEALRQKTRAGAFAPPVSLEVELENFAGTGAASGIDALEATIQLSKLVELGGKLDARVRVGAAQLDRVDAAQRIRRADVFAEIARRFVHLLSDQAQLTVAHRATELTEWARDSVASRIREGAISTVFLSRADIALARARIAEEHAEHELAASRVALAVSWGDTTPKFESATGELFDLSRLEPLDTFATRLDRNPDLMHFVSDERLLDARHRLAEAQRSPNVTFSAGVKRLETLNEQALVAGFSIPIGSRRRAEPEVSALRAERERLAHAHRARRLELHALLFGLYQEALHARTEALALRDEIQPAAERMLQTVAEGHRAGRYSLLELLDAQSELADIEREAIRAAAEFHTNLIEIERLTGTAVHTFAGAQP